jgi:hypothetical protein
MGFARALPILQRRQGGRLILTKLIIAATVGALIGAAAVLDRFPVPAGAPDEIKAPR